VFGVIGVTMLCFVRDWAYALYTNIFTYIYYFIHSVDKKKLSQSDDRA